jgi:hydroxyacylglutathione hydrolase
VIFRQLLDEDLGCAAYLIGDEREAAAVVVDPPYAVERLLAEAERAGVRIVRTLETHTHADHVSGHGRLALEQEIPVSIHAAAAVEYPNDALADGDVVELGAVRIRVIHTPGHRPEHCAFVVDDELLLTGDSLFVGDAARPDLAVDAQEGAEGLFRSLNRLTELPDDVAVFPGHVAGSLCGAAMRPEPSSTIGAERGANHALAMPDLESFVARITASLPPRPPTIARVVALNSGPFVGAPTPLAELDELPEDAVVLDVRTAEEFGAGHIPGAVNVPVGGASFATRAGFVLPLDPPLVLCGDDAEVERASRGLRSIGFLELAGRVVGVPADERMDAVELPELERLLEQNAVQLVDVREADESEQDAITGSTRIPYRLMREAAANGLSRGKPVVTICESGGRAAVAASVLASCGVDARPVLHGGVGAFQAQRRRSTG